MKVLLSTFLVVTIFFTYVLSDNPLAVGPCVLGRCQPGHRCEKDECIPDTLIGTQKLTQSPSGPCVGGMCPDNYRCHEEKCYKNTNE